ncbi:hypothetical protein L1887_07588 [Cichorium endivia]|nr:hypothetical protein L1887_07588 [Cichorium endivia]
MRSRSTNYIEDVKLSNKVYPSNEKTDYAIMYREDDFSYFDSSLNPFHLKLNLLITKLGGGEAIRRKGQIESSWLQEHHYIKKEIWTKKRDTRWSGGDLSRFYSGSGDGKKEEPHPGRKRLPEESSSVVYFSW